MLKRVWERIKNKLRGNRDHYLFTAYHCLSKMHIGKYKSRKVIMFRLDLIGDCTMFSGAARAIREFYGDREMTMVCLAASKPIFERLGIFDRFITLDFKPHQIDYEKLKRVIKEIRMDSYDIMLQPQASKFPIADILGAATKCNKRIAIETKVGNSTAEWVRKVNPLYDEFIPYPRGNVSEFDYYGAFVRGLGMPDYKTECPVLQYNAQHFIPGKYYVLYPGGSLVYKFWPADRFAKLAGYIYKKTGLIGVILGVSSEQWVSDRVIESFDVLTSISVIDLTGKTSISDVIDIIGNAEFVVSNDTSGAHIACATKTPCIVDVGGWHYDRFLPYHIENVKEDDCLPLVAYTKMPCYYCDWNWPLIGERNEECLHRMERGETCICIENISFDQMRELVDQVIKTEDCK